MDENKEKEDKEIYLNGLTPSEANEKWCPFSRSTQDGPFSANRGYEGKPDIGCMCLADLCMAWRWSGKYAYGGNGDNEDEEQLGFCGMAWK